MSQPQDVIKSLFVFCDNCGWKTECTLEQMAGYVNKPCSECGENLCTPESYHAIRQKISERVESRERYNKVMDALPAEIREIVDQLNDLLPKTISTVVSNPSGDVAVSTREDNS